MLPDDKKFSSSKNFNFAGKPAGLTFSTEILSKELFAFISVIEIQKNNAKPAKPLSVQLQTDHSGTVQNQSSKDAASIYCCEKASHNDGY